MLRPPLLQEKDFVAIVCTGRRVEPFAITEAAGFFMRSGWRVKTGYTVGNRHHQLGGTPEERADDFNRFLSDPDVRAIFVARGGFGHLDIVDLIDWSLLKNDPKWICGFSDVTVLHAHISRQIGIQSLHCIMPIQFSGEKLVIDSMESAKKILQGVQPHYQWNGEIGRNGNAEGLLTGGNLSVLFALAGSISEPNTTGKILFLEEVDEYYYHIDRMMCSLKRAGFLENLSGLVAGGFSDLNDHKEPFGETAREIILKHTSGYGYPVAFGFPAGHEALNLALPIGAKTSLKVNEGACEMVLHI